MRYNNVRFPALLITIYGLIGSTLAQIQLGTAASFGVIASDAVTNTGNTVITGSLGLFPNTESSITGFPPGRSGTVYTANDVANRAIQDAGTAYRSAASIDSTGQISSDLGGQTLVAGVYTSGSAVQITGPLTLDANNDPNALFVFQIGTTLTTESASSIVLINGARACNVYFQVGSSATLGSTTVFNGNILASTSISVGEAATVNGGLYALNGAVTLINDQVFAPGACVVVATTSTVPATTVTSNTDIITSTLPGEVTTISESGIISTQTGTIITRTTTASPVITTLPNGDVTTIPGSEIMTTTTDGGSTVTIPGTDIVSTQPGTVIITTVPGLGRNTTITSPTTRPFTRPNLPPNIPNIPNVPNVPFTRPNRPTTTSERSTTLKRSSTQPTLLTVRTSSRRATSSLASKASSMIKVYSVYVSTSVNSSASGYKVSSKSSTQPGYAQSRLAVTSKFYHAVTIINGTPCTTLAYFELTCSCTQTTVVPIAYTPAPQVVNMELTTMSGVPCTTTQYYEEACDCVRTSNVPIQIVSASASIATIINDVPCITSKYYEPACNCIQTPTVPVRIASADEMPLPAVDIACAPTANALFSCMSACMQPYMPTSTTTSTQTFTETTTKTSTQTCSATPRYRM